MAYFLHGTNHYVECPHCKNKIHPAKEPIPFFTCVASGASCAFFSFWGYIHLIQDDFLSAVLFTLCTGALLILAITILTMKRITFSK